LFATNTDVDDDDDKKHTKAAIAATMIVVIPPPLPEFPGAFPIPAPFIAIIQRVS
jgi:hypothetical protein